MLNVRTVASPDVSSSYIYCISKRCDNEAEARTNVRNGKSWRPEDLERKVSDDLVANIRFSGLE
jgi:hypothetical protein